MLALYTEMLRNIARLWNIKKVMNTVGAIICETHFFGFIQPIMLPLKFLYKANISELHPKVRPACCPSFCIVSFKLVSFILDQDRPR